MRKLALLILWPFIALADETIETLDGRRFLLKDNGTYELVISGPCSEPGYQQIDHNYRKALNAIDALIKSKAKLCFVGNIRATDPLIRNANFSYGDQTTIENGDGYLDFAQMSPNSRGYIQSHCLKHPCRAVVYGSAKGRWAGFGLHVLVHKIEKG